MNNKDYLIHYGVLGMKWGVRRYQNPDGTRTTLGKRREKTERSGGKWLKQNIKGGKDKPNISPAEKVTKDARSIANDTSDIVRISSKYSTKNKKRAAELEQKVKSMSDKELRDTINRINMERTYVSLNSNDTNRGREIANDILTVIASVAGITGAVLGIAATAKGLK